MMIILDDRSDDPLYLQIYQQLKDRIFSGELPEGHKLPSTRTLAKTLNVGRNTIESAYAQLCSEGYLESRIGSGFIVNKIDIFLYSDFKFPDSPACTQAAKKIGGIENRYDFQYGKLNPDDFPLRIWRKYTNDALQSLDANQMLSYNDRQGEYALRVEIMNYLKISRGVHCCPEQIVICSGTQPCLSLICQLLKPQGADIAFEEPGYIGARDVFINHGYQIIPITVEADGIDVSQLESSPAKIVYITPSHQFPTGAVLPIQKRMRLLDWANKHDGVIIEDDYDSELRYNSRPIPSIQGIDPLDRVVYIGTFSKTLAPALRLSYMVLPLPWLEIYKKRFASYNNPVPWLHQKTLTLFMSSGHWERHLRKICLAQKRKHDLLIRTIRELTGGTVHVHGENAGLHILLEFADKTEQALIEQAHAQGVTVYPVSDYWINREAYAGNSVLLGFSGLNSSDLVEGLQRLKRAWFDG